MSSPIPSNGRHPAPVPEVPAPPTLAAAPVLRLDVNSVPTPDGPVAVVTVTTQFGVHCFAIPAANAKWLAGQLTKAAAGLA